MGVNKAAITAWIVAGLLLLAWSVGASGINAGQAEKYDDQVAAAQREEQFYRIVASQGEGGSGVLNKLAIDLRDYGEQEGELTQSQLIRALGRFRGDSNRYGGISEELGFDPFNGENCSECGPLDEEVISRVAIIRKTPQGADVGLRIVLADLQPVKEQSVSGPPVWLWFLWAPSIIVFLVAKEMLRERRKAARFRQYGPELALVHSLTEAMHELPPGQRDELAALRERLMDGIEQRVKYGEQEAKNLRLEALRTEAEETLEAITEGNRVLRP